MMEVAMAFVIGVIVGGLIGLFLAWLKHDPQAHKSEGDKK